MSEIKDQLPDNNLPEFLLTDREIEELEHKYDFDKLRKQLLDSSDSYGEYQGAYQDYFERGRGILQDEIYGKGLRDLKNCIEMWTVQVDDYDDTLIEHLLKYADETTGSRASDINDKEKICQLWVKYIIQEDP